MTNISFFNEQTEQSLVKATIVSKYFDVWANVIISTQKRFPERSSCKIAYIDLFAGPSRYTDDTQSTPIKILKNAIEKPDIRDRIVTLRDIFFDVIFNKVTQILFQNTIIKADSNMTDLPTRKANWYL